MKRVAVAGASGFVGRSLIHRLAERYEVIALSRHERPPTPRIRWRAVDLFNLLQCEQALEGADLAVYLVHNTEPSARLSQGSSSDLDLLLADNFARAARKAGVRQIVYLGGLLPDGEGSPLLASRSEVEEALAAHGTPVTTLRAGMVVGAGAPSFRILRRLLERLPVVPCPRWTATPTQPIALDDVVELLFRVTGNTHAFGQVYDVGGPEITTFRDLLAHTARRLGLHRALVPVPQLSAVLSKLWISLVTGAPTALVGPMVESHRHPMVARDRRLQEEHGLPGATCEEAVQQAITASLPRPIAPPPAPPDPHSTVRSVQRLPNPAGLDGREVSAAYLRWLPRGLRPLLRVEVVGEHVAFYARPLPWPLLELTGSPPRSTRDRVLFYVTGGLLARTGRHRGRLEFRTVPGGPVLAAIHDFVPRLPWWVYRSSQALVHLAVMKAFGLHLSRLGAGRPQRPSRGGQGMKAEVRSTW